MADPIEETLGTRYGRLTIQSRSDRGPGLWWNCLCDCGRTVTVVGHRLRNGHTKSCGCLKKQRLTENITKHGGATKGNWDPLYTLWQGIKQRCVSGKGSSWDDYGALGIKMHEPWHYDFPAFRDWMRSELGDRPEGMSLDRIDPNGHYEPGNLRWADRLTQARNKRGSAFRVDQLRRERDDLAELVLKLLGHQGNQ